MKKLLLSFALVSSLALNAGQIADDVAVQRFGDYLLLQQKAAKLVAEVQNVTSQKTNDSAMTNETGPNRARVRTRFDALLESLPAGKNGVEDLVTDSADDAEDLMAALDKIEGSSDPNNPKLNDKDDGQLSVNDIRYELGIGDVKTLSKELTELRGSAQQAASGVKEQALRAFEDEPTLQKFLLDHAITPEIAEGLSKYGKGQSDEDPTIGKELYKAVLKQAMIDVLDFTEQGNTDGNARRQKIVEDFAREFIQRGGTRKEFNDLVKEAEAERPLAASRELRKITKGKEIQDMLKDSTKKRLEDNSSRDGRASARSDRANRRDALGLNDGPRSDAPTTGKTKEDLLKELKTKGLTEKSPLYQALETKGLEITPEMQAAIEGYPQTTTKDALYQTTIEELIKSTSVNSKVRETRIQNVLADMIQGSSVQDKKQLLDNYDNLVNDVLTAQEATTYEGSKRGLYDKFTLRRELRQAAEKVRRFDPELSEKGFKGVLETITDVAKSLWSKLRRKKTKLTDDTNIAEQHAEVERALTSDADEEKGASDADAAAKVGEATVATGTEKGGSKSPNSTTVEKTPGSQPSTVESTPSGGNQSIVGETPAERAAREAQEEREAALRDAGKLPENENSGEDEEE